MQKGCPDAFCKLHVTFALYKSLRQVAFSLDFQVDRHSNTPVLRTCGVTSGGPLGKLQGLLSALRILDPPMEGFEPV